MLPVPNPSVIYKALSEGAVLFSTEEEVYFGLNEVGALVWESLPPVRETLDDLCAVVAARYPDAQPDMIRADIAELLADLAANGLVVSRSDERFPDARSHAEHDARARAEAGAAESARVG